METTGAARQCTPDSTSVTLGEEDSSSNKESFFKEEKSNEEEFFSEGEEEQEVRSPSEAVASPETVIAMSVPI